MEFLLAHWHCILPAAAILLGMFFMNRGQPGEKDNSKNEGAENWDRDIR